MFRRFVVLIASAFAVCSAADNVKVVEEIAAKVNGDIITRGELARKRLEIETEAKRQGLSGARLQQAVDEYSANALREEIDTLLLVQKGKDLNINVDPEVTRRLAEIQVQQKISDPDKFQGFIRENTGMSYEDFKLQMKNQMLTQRVIGQEVSRNVTVPETETQKYYDDHKTEYVRKESQVFLSQIVISIEGKTPAQVAVAEKKAADLDARAKKGEKFNELARDNSDDVETAKNGRRGGRHFQGPDGQADRRPGLRAEKGLRERCHPAARFPADPQSGRSCRSRAGFLRRSEERHSGAPYPNQDVVG